MAEGNDGQALTSFADVTLRQPPQNDQEWDTFLERYANDRPEVNERPSPHRADSNDSLSSADLPAAVVGSSNMSSKPLEADHRTRAQERQRMRQAYEETGYLPGPEPDELSMRRRRRMVIRLGLASKEIEAEKKAVIDKFTKLAKLIFNVEKVEVALVTGESALRRLGEGIPSQQTINFRIGICPHYGLEAGAAATVSVENHDFFHRGPVVLPDLSQDWRFKLNPTITHPTTPTLFYASVPLLIERSRGTPVDIGTLCLSGSKPKHDFSAKDGEMLTQYAALLVKQLQTLQGEQNSKRVGALQMASIDFIKRSVQPEAKEPLRKSSMESVGQRAKLQVDGRPRRSIDSLSHPSHRPKSRGSVDSLHKLGPNPLVRTINSKAGGSKGDPPKFRTAPKSIRHVDTFQMDKETALCMKTLARRTLEQSQISYSNLQAHELRTPTHQLLAITALLRTAMQELANADASEQATILTTTQQVRDLLPYLDAIDTAGRTLHDIIDNILSFLELRSKDADPTMPSVPSAHHGTSPRSLEVMFEDVIQQVSEDHRQLRKLLGRPSGRIETVFEIVPPLLGESLEEDHGSALESALVKILSNAYKFIEGDGYVQITIDDIPSLLPPVGYDDMAAVKRVSIKIEDSGKGMDASFLEHRLFEPFAKEDPFTPGSGLSVHLAHRIIDLMGGQMAVSSTPGHGCTVYIEVPLPRRDLTVDADDSAAELTQKPENISGRKVFLAGFEEEDQADYGLRRLGQSLHNQFKKLGCEMADNIADADLVVADGRLEEGKGDLKEVLTHELSDVVFVVDENHNACSEAEQLAESHGVTVRRFRKPMTPAILREILHPDHAEAISTTSSNVNSPKSVPNESAVNSPESVGPNGATSLINNSTRHRAGPVAIEDTIASLSIGDYFSSRRGSIRRGTPRNRLPSPISPLTGEVIHASPSPGLPSPLPEPKTVSPSPVVDICLLVVEDNKINRVILCQMLRHLKAKIIEAVDGVEAVEEFKKLSGPAVILLDINMPRMDGFSACKEFRAIEAAESRKPSHVIAVTALGSEAERQRGVVVEIDVWMQKPCGKVLINKAVDEGRKRLQSS